MPLLIKRYPNRKLYNTQAKKYISLIELAALVRQGVEIQVRDQATGEDQTALTLSQILLEQEKMRSGFIPPPLLATLIQTGGNALEVFRSLVTKLFDLDRVVDEEITRRIDELVSQGTIQAEEGRRWQEHLSQPGRQMGESPSAPHAWFDRYLEEQGYATRQDYAQLVGELEALAGEVEELRRKR